MEEPNDKTFESRILDQSEGIRERILAIEAFHEWKSQFSQVNIDDMSFYIQEGDILRDEDQLIFEWALKNGLLSEEDIDQEQ